VEQICFTENQISLAFDGSARITVEGTLIYKHSTAELAQEVRPPVDESSLMRLLGNSVVEASTNGGALTLVFSNRDTLTILDDSENYESYQIQIGETVIIV
jgi:hypothetical protein